MTDDEARALTDCPHTERKPVLYTDSGGKQGVRLQCQRCGHSGTNVKQAGYVLSQLPPFDKQLEERWRQYEKGIWDQCRAAYFEEQAKRREDWFAAYKIYLQSKHWEMLRRRVIVRDEFTCQRCFRRVEVDTAHVHHLSYDTYNQVGQSVTIECITLCRSCHEEIEAAKRQMSFVREASTPGY